MGVGIIGGVEVSTVGSVVVIMGVTVGDSVTSGVGLGRRLVVGVGCTGEVRQ